jgi:CspA family cold shock protein
MPTGIVKWFDPRRGYGFITPDDGSAELFVHFSAIQATGYRSLPDRARVQFDVGVGPRGPVAQDVRRVEGLSVNQTAAAPPPAT